MAGRCKKATRVVLTEESARALGVPDVKDAMAPEALAAAWEQRCNQVRGANDHPINCVGFGSAEDYCLWKKRRLPTSAEWTAAATGSSGRKFSWGDEAPECSFACYGLNGSCVTSSNEVASCAIGSRKRDATQDGIVDLAGNLAEWVGDEGAKQGGDGPAWRVLRGGSFLDEASAIATSAQRSAPPVTAYVSIGFRCALDIPATRK
jgi:serine/threonine-protein kinase